MMEHKVGKTLNKKGMYTLVELITVEEDGAELTVGFAIFCGDVMQASFASLVEAEGFLNGLDSTDVEHVDEEEPSFF